MELSSRNTTRGDRRNGIRISDFPETLAVHEKNYPSRYNSETFSSRSHFHSNTPPMSDTSLLVSLCTYNEAENLPLLVPRILAAVPQAHVLVIDDNSPMERENWPMNWPRDARIKVLHRTGKLAWDGHSGGFSIRSRSGVRLSF